MFDFEINGADSSWIDLKTYKVFEVWQGLANWRPRFIFNSWKDEIDPWYGFVFDRMEVEEDQRLRSFWMVDQRSKFIWDLIENFQVLELAKRIHRWPMVGSTKLANCFVHQQKSSTNDGRVGGFSKCSLGKWNRRLSTINDRVSEFDEVFGSSKRNYLSAMKKRGGRHVMPCQHPRVMPP